MDFSKAVKYSSEATTAQDCYSYLDCDVVVIDKYVPSRLESDNVCIAQDELPGGGTIIYFDREYYGTLALRIPADPAVMTEIFINGYEYDYAITPGEDQALYALVAGPFEKGCRVKLAMKMPERAKTIPHNPTMKISPVMTSNGTVSLNETKSRFLLTLEEPAELVTFTLPENYDIEINGKSCGNAAELILGDTLFTSYKARIFTEGHSSYRDFDLVIMQAVDDEGMGACAVNAYTPITGAFAGEAAYLIDRRSHNTENATHGTADDPMLAIDPVTGYKWGRIDADKADYYFELENGGYEVSASFTGEGARLVANPGTEYEKVLVRETTTEVQRYGIRITDGQLVLSVCEGDPGIDFMMLTIRAIDTIATESGYEMIYDGRKKIAAENDDAGEYSEEDYDDEYPEDEEEYDNEYAEADDYSDGYDSGEDECFSEEYATETGKNHGESFIDKITFAENESRNTGEGSDVSADFSREEKSVNETPSTRTVSVKPSTPMISVSKTSSTVSDKRKAATQNYINNKLAVKKNSDAKKSLGIAAAGLVLAGSIIALLKKDK